MIIASKPSRPQRSAADMRICWAGVWGTGAGAEAADCPCASAPVPLFPPWPVVGVPLPGPVVPFPTNGVPCACAWLWPCCCVGCCEKDEGGGTPGGACSDCCGCCCVPFWYDCAWPCVAVAFGWFHAACAAALSFRVCCYAHRDVYADKLSHVTRGHTKSRTRCFSASDWRPWSARGPRLSRPGCCCCC